MVSPSGSQLSRRDFLARSLGAASLFLPPFASQLFSSAEAFAKSPDSILVSPSMVQEGDHTLCTVFNINKGHLFYVRMPLQVAHGATFAPGRPQNAYVFENTGPMACEIDLREGKVTRTFSALDGHLFGGHGLGLTNGVLYTSEFKKNSLEGQIVGRRLSDLKVVSTFSSGGFRPHQFDYLPAQELFVIANEASPAFGIRSNLAFVSAKDGRLVAEGKSDVPGLTIRHLALTATGDVCLAVKKVEMKKNFDLQHLRRLFAEKNFREAYLYGTHSEEFQPMPLMIYTADRTLKTLEAPADTLPSMRNSNSIAIDKKRGVVALSHVFGESASFWELASGKLLYHHRDPAFHPLGVDFDPGTDSFLISTYNQDLFSFGYPLGPPKKTVASRLLSYTHLFVNRV